MSLKGRINHIAKALQEEGFYPKEASLPGCVNIRIEDALGKFLDSKNPKSIKKVVNAFRSLRSQSFLNVGPSEVVTKEIREAVENFIERNRVSIEFSTVPEQDMMEPWETSGGSAG